MNPLSTTAVLLLLIPWVSTQVTQRAFDGSPPLHFVAQLSVRGCALFVHDTGANDGPHLAVEPIMCVTERLHNVTPRYDPVTQQMYLSVPVMLRDEAMRAEVQSQLRHLSPKSVKFATVSDISVSIDNSSKFQALGFDWTPDHLTGILRLGCEDDCSIRLYLFAPPLPLLNILSHVLLSATIVTANGTISQLKYRPMLQNSSLSDPNINSLRYPSLPSCQQLRFVRSIRIANCTARVHQRLDMKGHFLIEPLLCHNITSMRNESVMYDYSRDMFYLKLDVVLQDDAAIDVVKTQLADLSPLSVDFMRLWRAESHVASALSRRFEIGPLMLSGDWRSAQLRVYCRTEDGCGNLRLSVITESILLWQKLKWIVASLVDFTCVSTPSWPTYINAVSVIKGEPDSKMPRHFPVNVPLNLLKMLRERQRQFIKKLDQGHFVVIQQRQGGIVSFQRTWAEYETGFGDVTDFWIGLSAIHSLSMNGATLRVEMKLWDGTELHAEYAGFKVGDASTNYRMTYREMLRDRSSVSFDAMEHHKGDQFSTMDSDNDRSSGSCSNTYGKGGWWFKECHHSNPNGLYHHGDSSDPKYCSWVIGSRWASLREVRLMLQI